MLSSQNSPEKNDPFYPWKFWYKGKEFISFKKISFSHILPSNNQISYYGAHNSPIWMIGLLYLSFLCWRTGNCTGNEINMASVFFP